MPQDQKKIISGAICPYCHCETKLVEGDVIYPNLVNELPRPKFLDKYYYQCTQNRDHYVGTYADNITSYYKRDFTYSQIELYQLTE